MTIAILCPIYPTQHTPPYPVHLLQLPPPYPLTPNPAPGPCQPLSPNLSTTSRSHISFTLFPQISLPTSWSRSHISSSIFTSPQEVMGINPHQKVRFLATPLTPPPGDDNRRRMGTDPKIDTATQPFLKFNAATWAWVTGDIGERK